ncbi:immunoglobulin-binding protein 1-like isoform X2 [Amphiura filiformis]|uniref:immunoglobulin-binding protein 1-like isoform X2 n=1 Tax=Amphiura filiformis TaxID=82378 RepID=UPI003B21B7F3
MCFKMATSIAENDVPNLSKVFDDGLKIHLDIEESTESTNSKTYQDNLQKAIDLLEKATRMVNELSLFSRNEELEELPTSDIRYLLLPAILGDLTLRLTGEERVEVVQKGKTYFVDYLKRCRQYGVTKQEIPQDPPVAAARPAPGGRPNLMGMQANREEKIRRYKEAKELEDKLKALGSWSDIRHRDDEVQRKFYQLYLTKWVSTSLEQIGNIQQEIEILQHMAKMKESAASRGPEQDQRQQQQLPPNQARKPMKPFILTRDAVQAQVFGAGYPSIPTMTLDEFYQKEIREGKIKLDSHNPTPVSERQQAEDQEIKKETQIETDDPEALAKARQWDDWKDDHKRGWGNRENMG